MRCFGISARWSDLGAVAERKSLVLGGGRDPFMVAQEVFQFPFTHEKFQVEFMAIPFTPTAKTGSWRLVNGSASR